jgi:nitrogenase molybdenum-iron protein alpha/beta subunit
VKRKILNASKAPPNIDSSSTALVGNDAIFGAEEKKMFHKENPIV